MTSERELDADLIVVGAGPVGLLLAADVALGGGSVLVVERTTRPDDVAKAGSVNLASAEIFAGRGLLEVARAAQATTMAPIIANLAKQTGADPEQLAATFAHQAPRAPHFAGIMLDPGLLDHDDPDVRAHSESTDAMFVAQPDVEALLAAHADRLDVPVRRGVTFVGLRELEDRVEIDTDQGTLAAAWVVGCDGGRSPVRHAAGFDFPGTDPEITGRQAIVDLAENDANQLGLGWHWTPHGTYRHGPKPGNVVTVEFDGPPTDRESPVTAQEMQDSLRRVTGTEVTVTGLRGTATRWTDHARQATTYRKGRVLLAGDAAHVHSPFSGQGLNLGLGDASNLGWKLAAVMAGRAPESLLDTYTTERHPIGEWVLNWTRAQVALMRPDTKTGQLRTVVTDLLSTSDGLTRVTNAISGITQTVDLPGEHPLVGRLVPDLELQDGRPWRERFADGCFVLLDRTADQSLAATIEGWTSVVTIAEGRPDGGALVGCWPAPTASSSGRLTTTPSTSCRCARRSARGPASSRLWRPEGP